MKFLLSLMLFFGLVTQAQTITSPIPNLSNEILLSKSQTYVYIYNGGPTQITTNLSIPPNLQDVSIGVNRCASIKAKQSCYIIVSFNNYKISTPSFSVSLLNNSFPFTTLRYNANLIESLSVNPTFLSLGTITTEGLTSPQLVTVTNTGNTGISPVVSSSNSNLQISSNSCLTVILPSNTCSFNVRYNALSSTPNGVLSGLSVSVTSSVTAIPTLIPVSGSLNLAPVIIAASQGSVSTGGSVPGDKYLFVVGNATKAYNPTSNIFYSWGGSSTLGPNTPQPVSVGANLGGKQLKKIASSNTHNCAIATDDQAYCWGFSPFLGLGYDYTITYPQMDKIPTPVKRTGALAGKTIKDIGVGQNFTCAIASDDKVYCWGLNGDGAIGINNSNIGSTDEPVQIYMDGALSGKTIKSLNVEQFSACAIASDNLAYCWGFSYTLSAYNFAPAQVPMTGILAGKTVKSLYTSGYTNCLIASDDKPYCWGYGGQGQLTSLMADSLVPVPIDLGNLAGKVIKEIRTGGYSMYALTEDNKVYSWGSNYGGALGLGPTSDQNAIYNPTEIYMGGALSGKTIKSLYSSPFDSFACVIASDNQAYCWGANGSGGISIFGNGQSYTQIPYSLEPVAVYTGGALAGKQIKSMHLSPYYGNTSVCALAGDNNVYCWGSNNVGQLGNGTFTSSLVPVLAPTP